MAFPICSSADQVVRKSFADRSYFREALATGDFALSDYIIGRVTGKPIIVLALPRMRDGVVETVLIAAIDLDWMSRIAAETGSSLGAEVLLIDKGADRARRLSRSGGNGSAAISRSESAISSRALKETEPASRTISLDGKSLHRRSRAAPRHQRGARGDAAARRGHREANRQARYEIGKILLAGILSFLVIWLGGELLVVRPIQSLARGAERLGSGELTASVPTEGLAPELKRLGESFNPWPCSFASARTNCAGRTKGSPSSHARTR